MIDYKENKNLKQWFMLKIVIYLKKTPIYSRLLMYEEEIITRNLLAHASTGL